MNMILHRQDAKDAKKALNLETKNLAFLASWRFNSILLEILREKFEPTPQ
jgi:hypothetical protein